VLTDADTTPFLHTFMSRRWGPRPFEQLVAEIEKPIVLYGTAISVGVQVLVLNEIPRTYEYAVGKFIRR
jgi:hypothetical protein